MPEPVPATRDDAHTIPKVELHVHLGGSITEATALELCRRHGEDAATLGLVDGRYPVPYPDFPGFLRALMAANAVVRTPDDLELVARRFAEAQAAQGVAWTEVIVTAMTYARNGIGKRPMWEAIRSGLAAGGTDTRIGIIVDTIRDFGRQEAFDTLSLVDGADAPIVGLGLTGIEGTMPAATFVPLEREARRLGFGFEVHAGEMGPPESVSESLDILHADRIGHGVASIRDPELVQRLVRDQTPVEVCPSSNVGISAYPSLAEHPIGPLWEAGVNVSVNSDDPPFFATTLVDELHAVTNLVGLTRADLAELQRRAARAAFLPAADRQDLVRRIDAWEAGPVVGG